MRFTHGVVCLITVATAGLVPMVTAAGVSPSSVRGAADETKGCIKVTATIPVGSGASGVAADPKTSTVYVTNKTDGTVSVLAACPA
jgi:DNA-binding beta-propeller fold protein YncE